MPKGATPPRKASPPTISEKEFQNTVTGALDLFGWMWYHNPDSRRCNAGFPDIIAVKGNVMLALELKRETGRATVEQYKWLDALKAAGARSYVVRPSNWEMLLKIIQTRR